MSFIPTERPHTVGDIYFVQLDGLRCVAVIAVLISHWVMYNFIDIIPLGSMGVNLFFVISGFLITRILFILKERNGEKGILYSLKQFYIRRTLRIFPIYYLTVFVLLIVNFPAARENAIWLLTYTLNIKFALPGVWESDQLTYMIHLWSLSVEEQFYLLFPVIILLIPKRKIKMTLVIVVILGVIFRVLLLIIDAPLNSLYVLTPSCLDAFGIGSLLAYYLVYDPIALKRILDMNYLFALAALFFIAYIFYSRIFIEEYKESRNILERLLFSVCCFWIVGKAVLANYHGLFKKFLEYPVIIFLGKLSYGLYIYHYFVLPLLVATGPLYKYFLQIVHYNTVAKSILFFIITFVIAVVSWYLIEQPLNKFKNRFNYSTNDQKRL